MPQAALVPILAAAATATASGIASSIAANKARKQAVEDETRYNIHQTPEETAAFEDKLASITNQNLTNKGLGLSLTPGGPSFNFGQGNKNKLNQLLRRYGVR